MFSDSSGSSNGNRFISILSVAAMAAIIAACGGGQSGGGDQGSGGGSAGETTGAAGGDFPVTVTDSLGREVTIEEQPQEIASIAPSVTETLFEVGAGDELVGVTTSDDYPPEATEIETVGDAFQVNAEKVASLGTDVMFMSFDSTTEEMAETLEDQTGAEVVVINPTTVDEALESIGQVGTITGDAAEAEELEQQLRDELAEIQSAVEGEEPPTVFYELGYDPLYTVGPGSFVEDALTLAGGENVVQGNQPYPEYSAEQLVTDDPEFYLVGDSSGNAVADVEGRPAFGELQAVQDGNVEVVEDALISRPGPRVVEGIRNVAEILHPDAFQE